MDSKLTREPASDDSSPPTTAHSLSRKLTNRARRLLRWLGVRPSPRRYWEARAVQYGVRSVMDLRHPTATLDSVTATQAGLLFPLLRGQLRPGDHRLLDFGCGPGRFTAGLATLTGGTALGVDPIARYLELAPRAPGVEYRVLERGRIPAPDASFDIVWICLVLGGIVGRRELKRTVREIERVLRPGGLIFVVENTSPTPDGYYWHYRSIEAYQRMFPSVSLSTVSEYMDIDQRMSVFAGRKR